MFDPKEHPTANWPHALSLESLLQDDGMGEPVDGSQSWIFLPDALEIDSIFDPYLHFIADMESFYDFP